MKILFIWPNMDVFGYKPMGISLLASILKRDGHEVELFDTTFIDLGARDYSKELTKHGYFKPVDYGVDTEKKKICLADELEAKVSSFKPDIIAISCLSDEVDISKQMITHLSDVSKGHIIVGNKGVEKIMRDVASPYVSFFIGESIVTLPQAIKFGTYCSQRVHYPHGYFKDLDSLPFLDWSMFDQRQFLKAYDGHVFRGGDHMIGWGCPNSCTYCINKHWRELHGGMSGCMRRYSVSRIIDELIELTKKWDLEIFKFHDEDFLLKPMPYLKALSYQYADQVGRPWSGMTNTKSVTEDRADCLVEMNCLSMSVGVESGDENIRNMLNRRETPEDIIRGIGILKRHKIRVSTFNMIGLPFDTEETILKTIELNRRAEVEHPNISFFMPLEGTDLYKISVDNGFYDPKENIELRTDRPVLKLPGISAERLQYYHENFHRLVTQ